VKMSENNAIISAPRNPLDRVEIYNYLQEVNGEVNTPVFRLLIDLSYNKSVGRLQQGYYLKMNDQVYFVSKQNIEILTNSEAEKVFTFLHKTQVPFTISVRHTETISGHQRVELLDITNETEFYSLREYKVFKGLWRTIEGELFENKYSPAMARFTSGKLDWYVKLMPEYPLKFKENANISTTYVTSQGHLDIYKVVIGGSYAFPSNLYSRRRKLTFFNHTIEGDMYVIPLGAERRVINISQETQIASPDHETVVLQPGEYLLIHPRPRDAVD